MNPQQDHGSDGRSSEDMAKGSAMTVRFSPSIHAIVKAEAEKAGVSMAEFVREAAFAKALWCRWQREGDEDMRDIDQIAKRLRTHLEAEY
jgi:hypothetical protein